MIISFILYANGLEKSTPKKIQFRTIFSQIAYFYTLFIVFCNLVNRNQVNSRGAIDLAYNRIAPELSSYMGGVFEDICKQYLWKLLLDGKCAVNFTDLGRWWGTNPKTKSQEEIDIMGTDNSTALFAEFKWTNEKIDLSILETLVERLTLFSYEKTHFYLFAKTGFTKGYINKSNEMGNVTLVTYKDILKAY